MNHDLDFHDKDPTHLIGRLHVDANQSVVLKVFQRKWILELDALDRMRQIQNRIEQADQADFIARLPEDFAKRKIYPRANTYFL